MPPYPYPDDDTILRIASGADDPESDEFVECEKCRARPGMVALCADCLRRRRLFFERKLAKASNPSAADICAKAAELVGGERDRTHGTKRENFRKIAALWNAYLTIRPRPAPGLIYDLGPVDVGHMMALMKIARTQHGAFNLDDYIDGAGYLGCAGEIAAQLNAEGKS